METLSMKNDYNYVSSGRLTDSDLPVMLRSTELNTFIMINKFYNELLFYLQLKFELNENICLSNLPRPLKKHFIPSTSESKSYK